MQEICAFCEEVVLVGIALLGVVMHDGPDYTTYTELHKFRCENFQGFWDELNELVVLLACDRLLFGHQS